MKLKPLKALQVASCILFFTTITSAQDIVHQNNDVGLSFKSRLWYSSDLALDLGPEYFSSKIAPTVGYKLTKKFSMGLRLPMSYSHYRHSDNFQYKSRTIELGLGAFARYDITKNIFAQAEYNTIYGHRKTTSSSPVFQPDVSYGKFRDELNIGLGFKTNGKIGFETSVLYNVLESGNPWQVRFGINFKF